MSEKSEVRFRHPNHILVMKFDEGGAEEDSEDEEDEEETEDDGEETTVVYYSSSNDRSTHLITTKHLEHVCFVDSIKRLQVI